MMQITEKQSKIFFGIIMAFFMALTMSFIMVLINVGMVKAFILIWMKSFLIGFLVAVPTSMLAAPFTQKCIEKIANHGK